MTLKLLAYIVVAVFAWGSGYLTGANTGATYTVVIACDTDADCEEKNPHIHADAEGDR